MKSSKLSFIVTVCQFLWKLHIFMRHLFLFWPLQKKWLKGAGSLQQTGLIKIIVTSLLRLQKKKQHSPISSSHPWLVSSAAGSLGLSCLFSLSSEPESSQRRLSGTRITWPGNTLRDGSRFKIASSDGVMSKCAATDANVSVGSTWKMRIN